MYFYGMRWILLFTILTVSVSCRYFETERISSEQVLQEELKAMDWSDIDTYPSFPSCDGIMEKQEQRNCFESVILTSIRDKWALGNWVVSHAFNDTLILHLEVDTTGRIIAAPIVLDSLLKSTLPKMDSLLLEAINTLQRPAPAYKRGIPVRSKFTLPVVINTKDL